MHQQNFLSVEFKFFSTLLLFKFVPYKININKSNLNLQNLSTRYFLVPANYGHSYSTHVGMARERFFRVIPRRMEDPADLMELAAAGGYPGKFSYQLISRLNLSCLSMTEILVLAMLMSPDIRRKRVLSILFYEVNFFFFSLSNYYHFLMSI